MIQLLRDQWSTVSFERLAEESDTSDKIFKLRKS